MVDNLNYWYYVVFTLTSLSDASTTQIRVSSRPFLGTYGDTVYYPILKSIGSVGFRMGEYLPQKITGDIILDCSYNSFSYQRRFIDLLERYEIVDQPVSVYVARTSLTDTDPVSDAELVYSAKVLNWRLDAQSGDMTIVLDGQTIPNDRVARVIDNNFLDTVSLSLVSSGMLDAPRVSTGKSVPLVFGSGVDIRPIQISNAEVDTVPTSTYWAYATTYEARFVPSGIVSYHVKNRNGIYYEVSNPASNTTAVYSQNATSEVSQAPTYFQNLGNALSSSKYVVTGGKMKFWYFNNISWNAGENSKFIFSIYEKHPISGMPLIEIGRAEVLKEDYETDIRGSSAFFVTFWFPSPVVCNSDNGYIFVFNQTNDTTAGLGSTDLVPIVTDSVLTGDYYLLDQTSTSQGWRKIAGTTNYYFDYELYGVRFDDSPSPLFGYDSDGKGLSTVKASSRFYIGAVETGGPDMADLDFIVRVNGMKDDASGGITGAANTLITGPHHCLQMLGYQHDGTSWNSSLFDATLYSEGQNLFSAGNWAYARYIGGRTSGRALLPDLIADICYNTATRIGYWPKEEGYLGTWMWGATAYSQATFTEKNSKIISVDNYGSATVVNRPRMAFDNDLTRLNTLTGTAEGDYQDYSKNLDWSSSQGSLQASISSVSFSNFGPKYLGNETFDWVNTEVTASVVAQSFAAIYAKPHTLVNLETNYSDSKDLRLLDIVNIQHPDLPAYYGTSPDAHPGTFSATELELNSGHLLRRAQTYRAQVESKEYDLNTDSYPLVKLICRLLTNYPVDPT